MIKLGEVQVEADLMLTADSLAAPEVIMNAARVILHPKAAADQPVSDALPL